MPIPPNHQMVSAADYGGAPPVTSIECPKDLADVQAADIRRPTAALLAQFGYVQNLFDNLFLHGISVANDTVNGDAIGAIGNGTGRGLTATGGSSNGTGVYALGGATNGVGLEAQGTGTGFGASIAGGTNGPGAQISAGGGNNHGLDVYGQGAGHGLRVQQGNVQLNGTPPVATADPGQHVLSSAHYSKAWCLVQLDGVGGYAIGDAVNVASLTVTATYVEVTWARAFANANYAPIISAEHTGALAIVGSFVKGAQTTVKTRIQFVDALTGAAVNPATTLFFFSLDVKGRD